jgi:hypothetical protein
MSWLITPSFTQWTPALITTALWLDAADNATVFSDAGTTQAVAGSSTVQQWNDKSGNGRHASQSTSANRPDYTSAGQNDRNVFTLDGSNDSLALAANLGITTAHSIFVAAKNSATITAATSVQALLSGDGYTFPSTTTSDLVLVAGSLTGNLTDERLSSAVVADGPGAANVYGYGKTDADVSGGFFLSSAFTTTGDAFTGRLNGSSSFATVSSAGGYSSTNVRYPSTVRGIGYRFTNSTLFWNGQLWEIIVAPAYLSLDVTQRIEGYLAHKWGLTANLPNDHPYKVNPPAP